MAETPPPHPTPLPPPRDDDNWGIPAWPVILIAAIVLFTVAGLVLNLAGLFR